MDGQIQQISAWSGFWDGFIYDWGVYFFQFIVSMAAMTIVIERIYFYRKNRPVERYFVTRMKNLLSDSSWDEALALAQSVVSPAARVIQLGIELRLSRSQYIEEELQQAGNEEVSALERYLTGLATCATIAPLFGILGTVLGLIKAFIYYSSAGNKAGMVNGINYALITTAVGLVIAIPSHVAYNYLARRMHEKIINMEGAVAQIMPLLKRGVN